MLTFNLLDKTKQAIESIRSWHDWDLFVIDNESTDGTQEWLKSKISHFRFKKRRLWHRLKISALKSF